MRARKLKAVLIGFTVLVVLGIVVPVAFLISGGRGKAGISAALPSGGLAYVHVRNLDEFRSVVGEEDPVIDWMETIDDGALSGPEGQALEDIWHEVRALHLYLDGFGPGGSPEVLIMADGVPSGSPAEWLPARLGDALREESYGGGGDLYRMGESGMGKQMRLLRQDDRLFISTGMELLDEVREGLEGGRKDSLASSGSFQRAMDGMKGEDFILYVEASGLRKALEENLSGHDAREFRFVSELFSFKDIEAGALSMGFREKKQRLRLVMDQQSDAYRLLELPSGEKQLPEFVPADAMFFVSGNTGEATRRLEMFHEYLSSRLASTGEIRSQEEYYENKGKAEREIGFKFKDMAEVLAGEIGMVWTGGDEEDVCFFGRLTDQQEADRLVEQFVRGIFNGSISEETAAGVQIKSMGDWFLELSWATADGCMFVGSSKVAVRGGIEAMDSGRSIKETQSYKKLRGQLPSRNSVLGYLNVEKMIRAEPGDYEQIPRELRRVFEGWVQGYAINIDNGAVELTIVHNKNPILGISPVLQHAHAPKEGKPRVEKHQVIRMMGEVLKDRLPDNPRVLVIRYQIDPEMEMREMPPGDEEDIPTQEEMREERKVEVKEALERGFGKKVEIVGYEAPGLTEDYLEEGETAAEFNRVIAEYADDDVDLLISTIGLPRDMDGNIELDELTLSDLGSDVLFFADIGLQYNPDELRSLIEEGLLDGAVIHPSNRSRERRVITGDSLEDLPEEPPIEQ